MGCDIHMVVETRKDIGGWTRVETFPERGCPWCDSKGQYENGNPCYFCKGTGLTTEVYRSRNYATFSVLADVRNDGNIKPISEARGMPADATVGEGENAEYEHGDHSHTWLLLSEVLAYDWHQSIEDEGWVSMEQFKAWEAAGGPKSPPPKGWCASVGGGPTRHISNSEMRRRIKETYSFEAHEQPYTLVRWSTPLSRYTKHFLAFVETLAKLGAEPQSIRLVFGFDS